MQIRLSDKPPVAGLVLRDVVVLRRRDGRFVRAVLSWTPPLPPIHRHPADSSTFSIALHVQSIKYLHLLLFQRRSHHHCQRRSTHYSYITNAATIIVCYGDIGVSYAKGVEIRCAVCDVIEAGNWEVFDVFGGRR